MARMSTDGLARLHVDFSELENLPTSLIDDMLNAQAAVIEKAQKKTAREMGVWDNDKPEGLIHTADSIKRGKVVKTKGGRAVFVAPQGTVTRGKRKKQTVRLAEIAFVNEYGTHNQDARPFIKTANERAAPEAVKAAEKIYNEYLTKKGL